MEFVIDRKAAVKKLKKLVLTPKSKPEVFKSRLEDAFRSDFVPNHVEVIEKDIGGVKCNVLVPEVHALNRVILYVHGGSFIGGSCESYRSFCAELSNVTSSRVVVPDFRKPPESKYPLPLEDIRSVFHAVAKEMNDSCTKRGSEENPLQPEIIVAADGSGACIALSMLLQFGDVHRRLVSRVLLFSPWLSLSRDDQLFLGKKSKDEVISMDDILFAAKLYATDSDLLTPRVSPLVALSEDFAGFPPVYIQMGGKELLLDQSVAFQRLLGTAGVECTLDVEPGMMYMFQMAHEYVYESHIAVNRIGDSFNSGEGLSPEETEERDRLIKENNIWKS